MLPKSWGMLQLPALFALFSQSLGKTQNASSIEWTQCPEELDVPSECATLPVPLDYTNPESKTTLNLTLLKVKAVKEPFKGSILVNPGGPGNGGVSFLQQSAVQMLVMTGGHFDVIGFDPRGTGDTLPMSCYENPFDRMRAELLTPLTTSLTDTTIGTTWAVQKTYADSCFEQAADVGELMGTGFAARDMIQIVDALGEDGMLRFWGQSYGTALGATAAAMFPERIDRMVIDGVVNIHEYTDGWEVSHIAVLHRAFEQLLEACVVAGKDVCALAGEEGVTVQSLRARIFELAESLKYEPLVLGSNITTEVVSGQQILISIDATLRVPIFYAIPWAGYMKAILDRNLTAYHEYRPLFFPETGPFSGGYDGLFGIRCSDTTFRESDLENVKARVQKLVDADPLFVDLWAPSFLQCTQWRFEAKGRYEGNFQAKTKNPIMLIGSPYDARTPLVGAQNVSAGFEGSVVLQHNGNGHCVLYSPGQCAIKATQDYFTNGTLPAPGTICEQDFGMFSGKLIGDSFKLEDL